ncbi:FAD/NAD(P)-binding domain-containing protein [Tothia fuscella]|uniref:FAD/NAD(P)-binding domain-containing protein n=1 Tax=Tothia fuscella TaxID=1048955 RepID=A0A9P4NGV5_9PEZI|nr:FAD/NAD(P)-binding domain-containing protein [Tothia fuscella]
MVEREQPRVAIIGAGISGVVTAAHLQKAGLNVTVFERNHASGGVWLYDERRPLEPKYPSIRASEGENIGEYSGLCGGDRTPTRELRHAPPGPCYVGLKNNVGTRLMRTKLNGWPEGTPDFVNHRILKEYIQETSKIASVDSNTIYGALVTELQKKDEKWHLTYSTLRKDSLDENVYSHKRLSSFDYVVVASGHYHAPRVPELPGLAEWQRRWPSRVWHSKGYRKPEGFKGKNVLLIGAGTSSTDIAREIGPFANHVYQSQRNGKFDHPASMLPPNATRIGEISTFNGIGAKDVFEDGELDQTQAIPSTVVLKSGAILCNIDYVIVCTGYHITLPFLKKYHKDDTPPEKASKIVLVTDGTQLHNLHKDIFYIPDPSLIFVGVPYFTATFTLFEFQALTVAAVLSGLAYLPTEEAMREEYLQRVKEKGYGKPFHSLRGVEVEYVTELLDWINGDIAEKGGSLIEGHSKIWHVAKEEQAERIKQMFAPTGAVQVEFSGMPCN